MDHIYLDNHATTRVDERVLKAMMPFFLECYGNPSAHDALGDAARNAIDAARAQVASLIGAGQSDIFFTSGATEANNWALRGFLQTQNPAGKTVVCSQIEHSSVLETLRELSPVLGFSLVTVKPASDGIVKVEDVIAACNEDTILVTVMHANNEIGTLQPVAEIGQWCQQKKITFMVDAAQSLGKVPIDVERFGIDLLTASGHKIYAPKGTGFLFASRSARKQLNPILTGGGQERGHRAGTENVAGIVALGEACAISQLEMDSERERVAGLRNLMLELLLSRLPNAGINGCLNHRLPGNLNLWIERVESQTLLQNLPQLSLSRGSACHTGSRKSSHVLSAISNNDVVLYNSIRIGIGRFTTTDEVLKATDMIINQASLIRKGYLHP